MTDLLFDLFIKLQLFLFIGIMLVLSIRPYVQKRFGPTTAYRLWMIVPVLMLSSFLPARTISLEQQYMPSPSPMAYEVPASNISERAAPADGAIVPSLVNSSTLEVEKGSPAFF